MRAETKGGPEGNIASSFSDFVGCHMRLVILSKTAREIVDREAYRMPKIPRGQRTKYIYLNFVISAVNEVINVELTHLVSGEVAQSVVKCIPIRVDGESIQDTYLDAD